MIDKYTIMTVNTIMQKFIIYFYSAESSGEVKHSF